MRLGAQYEGEFSNGITYDHALTYSATTGSRYTPDTYINGLAIALQGYGVCGDANTGAIPTGAVAGTGGCEYYNPFSNAFPVNGVTGTANPNYVPGLENSAELANWMTDQVGTEVDTSLLVFDTVFSGASGVQAAGGEIGWAAGAQIRRETYKVAPNTVTDLTVNPGPGGTGPFSFLAGTTPSDEEQTIYALFGELQIPLYDKLDMQIAVRFEDYGGDVGSTFDPKVAAKYQVNDMFALRGSAQTSFRGPTLNQLGGVGTTLQYVAPTSAFKAVDTFGNPDLNPESAFSFNFGALFENKGFSASVDYWNFDFSDPIIVEEQANIVAAAITALGTASTDDDAVLKRITFQDPLNPVASGIARIETNITNGPDIQTSGIDLRAEHIWDLNNGAEFTIGADSTYVLEYKVAPYFVEGISIGGGDYVGQFNRTNFTRSMPQFKAKPVCKLQYWNAQFPRGHASR